MKALVRFLAPIFGALATAATALADAPAKVRSGEHEGFSRLVIEGAARGEWKLRRTAEGYAFRSADSKARYDTGHVYDLIPRTRIADLRGGEGGILNLVVNCDCHAKAFATGQQALVIDVVNGPADADSPFEVPDSAPERGVDAGNLDAKLPAALQPLTLPVQQPNTDLDLYWNRKGRAVGSEATTETPETTSADRTPEAVSHSQQQTDAAEISSALSHQGSRAEEMQRTLLEQLSRAASQGLVGFDTPVQEPREHKAPPSHEETPVQEWAMPSVKRKDTIPLHIETSIDRDAIFAEPPVALSADGEICPPDAFFAVSNWGNDQPATLQIAAARDGLVGEFDRVDPAKVTALAKLYVQLGFGAEARMTLRSFGVDGEEALWISRLARIEDGEAIHDAQLAKLTACDGTVALWALLGGEEPLSQSDLNESAIQRSFSELPLHLRRQLGPQAIERLIDAGATDTATGLRNAILRAGGTAEPALTVATATLAIESGDSAAGLDTLEAMALGNGPAAEDALVKAMRLRLDHGEAVPPELAANAGALAYEHRYSARGAELAALQVLALASTGDFTSAFAAEARMDDKVRADLRSSTLLRLFARLASDGDEWSVLHHFFANRDRLMDSGPDILLRLDLAERLTSAGFARAAAELLHGEAEATERGRLILARQALAVAEPKRALELISTTKGTDAAHLRAEALIQAGQPERAKVQFSAAGDAEGAARAAWLAGNWQDVGEGAPAGLTSAVQALGLATTGRHQDEATPEGELAASRRLVEEANKAHGALSDLIGFATAE